MGREIKYADPALSHVGSFQTPAGLNAVAQEGDIFHHFVNRPDKDAAGTATPRQVHHARIYREGNSITYYIDTGANPPSPVMSKVVSMLPLDMREKKVVLKKASTSEPAKL